MGIVVSLFYGSLDLPPATPQGIIWTLTIALVAATLAHGVEGLGLRYMPTAAKLISAIATLALSGSALSMALGALPNTPTEAAIFS